MEQAEDRARERALEALALEALPKPAPAAIAAPSPHRQRNNGTPRPLLSPRHCPSPRNDPAPPSPVVTPTPPASAPSLLEFEEKPNDYSELPFADGDVEAESLPDFGQNSLFETALPASSPLPSEVDTSPRNLDFPISTAAPPAAESWQPKESSTPAIATGPLIFPKLLPRPILR
ncbi:MAG: hypothetical protein HC890_04760 [Chloroflexaceae bacterium]|nr:hypothetical protein [Chloroflexaceae bacterium]